MALWRGGGVGWLQRRLMFNGVLIQGDYTRLQETAKITGHVAKCDMSPKKLWEGFA